ncbi:RloB family protein [Streptomyces albidoflavus]|uniref:RloB family protein n=1 Tax=Streptomyces TaxID=1883 RepID=UPI00055A07E7|nr:MULTISPECIES: RloB family protein [Streptomyces]RZE29647.1 RloB domain-containing protein [Streptomyces albidoflavus]WSD41648.1 RloB family protein [Streptomyces albidoflavus]
MPRTPKPSGRKGPARETNLRRPSPHRTPVERLLVVCGARVTEKQYFDGLRKAEENKAVSVKLVARPKSPSQVVKFAADRLATARDEYDQVWCVLDVDQFTDLPDALAEAERHEDLHIALSHPCFEVWLLLHLADHTSPAASYKALLPALRRHVPAYDKTSLDFERQYGPTWREAVRRAKKLCPPGKEPEVNPSTGVWRLAEAIGLPGGGR